MKYYQGKATCVIHGEYFWSGVFQEMGTVVVFTGKKSINCEHIFKRGSEIVALTLCPKCPRYSEEVVDTIEEAPNHV